MKIAPRAIRARSWLVVAAAGCLLASGCGGSATAAHPPPHPKKHAKPKLKPAVKKAVDDRTFTFVAGGDIALSGGGATSSTFAGIDRYLSGDLVFGNQEGTLATGGTPKCAPYGSSGCFTFRADPSSAAALKRAGFTVMNIANNHALDFGAGAQQETIQALESAGLAYDGLPGQISIVQAGTVKVAIIGCAPYPWAQSLLDIPKTAALVRAATRQADVVLVYMHAGAEGSDANHVPYGPESFLGEERGDVRAFSHTMIDAGAALVFASGPHTLRGIEWYHHHLIAYSLGNLAGSNTLSVSGSLSVSALLSLTLTSDGRFVSGRVIPLRLIGEGTPEYDSSGEAITTIRTLSDEDFRGPKLSFAADGTITPPSSQ
ncbi:MAG TPA: CapA family protein [Gaiellaceae bacterium]